MLSSERFPKVFVFALIALLACTEESQVPEDALWYDVNVTGVDTTCALTEEQMSAGYTDAFVYAVALDGSSATLYIEDQVFASGTVSGCNLDYQTVTIGEERPEGNLKWQIYGSAKIDGSAGSDACVEGDDAWLGTEYFEIVESEDEAIEVGCTYNMETTGTLTTAP